MKASAVLATAALSSLFALSASAEQYQGVLQFHAGASRASVKTEAVVASHSAGAGVPHAFASTLDHTAVRARARATAAHGVTEGTL
jgi:hypothetical protein